MVLKRWEPFTPLRRMEETMDRMWQELMRPFRFWPRLYETEALVPLDVYQTQDKVVVKATLPGVKAEEVEITFSGNTLTIHGEAKAEEEVKEENYLLREHRFGTFSRTVTLPEGLDTDKAEANYEQGILTISIPKREEVRPKTIKVKVVEGRKKA